MSAETQRTRSLVAAKEVEKISRAMLIWANTFPEKPCMIRYEFLDAGNGAETGMALCTIQGAYITRQYILGGYQAEYQFKLVYRIRPGDSNDRRLQADELLNRFGDWARTQKPDLGDGITARRVEATTRSSKFAAFEDGYEDYQILMKLTYEVNVSWLI